MCLELKNYYRGVNKSAIGIMNRLQKEALENENITLDLSGITYMTPFSMLTLALAIREHKDRIDINNLIPPNSKNTNTYMQYMRFYDLISDKLVGGNGLKSVEGRYIIIEELEFDYQGSVEDDYMMIDDMAKRFVKMFDFDKELGEYMRYSIFEIIRNVYEHARTPKLYITAQRYPKSNRVEIAIADEGCGTYSTLKRKFPTKSERQLIDYVIMPGISASSNHSMLGRDDSYRNSGYGLYMTKELALAYGGEFVIASGNYAKYCRGDECKTSHTHFKGTAIGLSFKTDNIGDFNALRNEIVRRAEVESMTNEDAIHKASKSSGGKYN